MHLKQKKIYINVSLNQGNPRDSLSNIVHLLAQLNYKLYQT